MHARTCTSSAVLIMATCKHARHFTHLNRRLILFGAVGTGRGCAAAMETMCDWRLTWRRDVSWERQLHRYYVKARAVKGLVHVWHGMTRERQNPPNSSSSRANLSKRCQMSAEGWKMKIPGMFTENQKTHWQDLFVREAMSFTLFIPPQSQHWADKFESLEKRRSFRVLDAELMFC